MSTSQISAAGAYAQADRLVVTIPVRPIDPTRQRFQVAERDAAEQTAARKARADDTDADESRSGAGQGPVTGGWGRGGFGLVGAFTSFLARMFAQPEAEQADSASSAQADGVRAYAQTAGAVMTGDSMAGEILSPSFPRLSSGRAVDLTV